jgi:hypothetical protein
MPKNRTLLAMLAAGGTAVALWFTFGSLSTTFATLDRWSVYAPSVPSGVRVLTDAPGAGLVAMLAVLALVLALSVPVLRSTTTGPVTTVLALWWVTIAAGGAGSLVWTWVRGGADGYPMPPSSAFALGPGVWWGLVTGWAVGLVGVAVRGRGEPAPRLPRAPALAAATTTAVLTAIGWFASGVVGSWALSEILPVTSDARRQARDVVLTLIPTSLGMSAPEDGSQTSAYALGALAVAVAVLLVGTAAALWASLRGGRTALVFGLWFATVVGTTAGAFVSALPFIAEVGAFGLLLQYAASLVVTGGVWGLMYGWVAALGGLLTAWLVDRRTARVVAPEPLPDDVTVGVG